MQVQHRSEPPPVCYHSWHVTDHAPSPAVPDSAPRQAKQVERYLSVCAISFSSTFFLLLQVTLQTRFTDRQHCLQHGYVQLLEARRVILHAIACLQLHKYINRGLQEAPTTRTHSRSRDSAGTRQSASPTRALLSSMITK